MIFSTPLSNYTTHQLMGFYSEAKTIHDIDSPFVYAFTRYIVEDTRNFYIFPLAKTFYREAKVSGHAFYSMSPFTGKRLFRAVHHFKPIKALEIGAGDGLSTLYQATAMLSGDLFSVEANNAHAAFAKKRLEKLGLPNVQITDHNWRESLPVFLKKINELDFIFFHQNTPADERLELLKQLLPKMPPQAVVVLSGIYHKPEQSIAWEWLKRRVEVTLSIDLFDLGFLFFDSTFREKQTFKIIPAHWKFWRLGLFR